VEFYLVAQVILIWSFFSSWSQRKGESLIFLLTAWPFLSAWRCSTYPNSSSTPFASLLRGPRHEHPDFPFSRHKKPPRLQTMVPAGIKDLFTRPGLPPPGASFCRVGRAVRVESIRLDAADLDGSRRRGRRSRMSDSPAIKPLPA
jgi:hypothetical protein